MRTLRLRILTILVISGAVLAFVIAGLFLLKMTAVSASPSETDLRVSTSESLPRSQNGWGEPLSNMTTTYSIYKKDFIYGTKPITITDIRNDDGGKIYSDKERYEIRALTVYRAYDGQKLLDHQPVVFFVHGGSWTDGYRDWYQFVARPFTGEKGWTTVVIDYRLTSDEVFLADQYCIDRATCVLTTSVLSRTKAAWYPDNIDDVAAALQWTVDHISENGGDADKIVVFGHSAGGHLASLMATSTYTDHAVVSPPTIKGLVSMSGAYNLNSLSTTFWSTYVSQAFKGGFSNYSQLMQASPYAYISSDPILPPFYLLYAEDDLMNLTEQNLAFKNELERLGFDVSINYLSGYGHSSEMAAIAYIDETPTQLIVNWIEGILQERVYLPVVMK